MGPLIHTLPDRYPILIADDEPDIHAVTKLGLRGLRFHDRPVEFLTASSGNEVVQLLKERPEIAVILLDVVMETDSAGLDACRAIRGELQNQCVRILLRTGQPGTAPEKQTIDDFDIDGYLPKAELTSTRLYSAVRAALKSWEELIDLERHRRYLTEIHECAMALHSFDGLEAMMEQILSTAMRICPASFGLLQLDTFDATGTPRELSLHLAHGSSSEADGRVEQIRAGILEKGIDDSGLVVDEHGILVPFALHHELGSGWMYLEGVQADETARQALSLLAGHAANALYSSVAQAMLNSRDGPFFETMSI